MSDLITEGWSVADRLYDRLGTKSARGLDIDACVIITKLVEKLEQMSEMVNAMNRAVK